MKKQLRKLSVFMEICMLVLAAGCGAPAEEEAKQPVAGTEAGDVKGEAAPNPQDITIGYIGKVADSFMLALSKGAEAASKELGVNFQLMTTAAHSGSVMEQAKSVEDLIAMGADAIVTSPDQPEAMKSILQEAYEKDVVIITVNSDIEDFEPRMSFVGIDDTEACYLGGQALMGMLPDGGKDAGVIIINGEDGQTGAIRRYEGYKKACEEAGAVVLDYQWTDWTPEKTASVLEDLITVHGDKIDAVCIPSDSMAAGAFPVLEQAGLTNKVLVCGMGGFTIAKNAFADNKIAVTIGMSPYQEGYDAVMAAWDALNGKEIEPFINSGVEIITQENYKTTDHQWID